MFFRIARIWIPLAVVATCAIGFAYLVTQQTWRLGANGVPEQLAGDASAALAADVPPAIIVGSSSVNIAASLSPWVVIYDGDHKPVAASGQLDGRPAQPPSSVFAAAEAAGTRGDRITWQPRPDVRQAIVVRKVTGGRGGYVVAGRSLRDVEYYITVMTALAALAWLVTMAASLASVALVEWWATRRERAVASD